MTALRRAVVAFWLLKLAVLAHNLRSFPVLRPAARAPRPGRVRTPLNSTHPR